MIKTKLNTVFHHHFSSLINFNDDIFIADYSEQTKTSAIKRSVEFFSPNPPTDITYCTVSNPVKLIIAGVKFNNESFVCSTGPKSQCEVSLFPDVSAADSWILFSELKYSALPLRNNNNLKKAISQLFRTRFYYFQENVITNRNTSYLIASLPLQSEPFANFTLSPAFLIKLKATRNIVLRLKNSVSIIDSKFISV